MDHRQAYQRAMARVVELVDEDAAGVPVPTCPGWTVKDLVAHLASLFAVYKAEGANGFTPDWGDREVAARADRSLQECLDEWAQHVRNPGDIFSESHLGPVAVADVLSHEQDIRTALDRPGGRDDENIVVPIDLAVGFLEQGAGDQGLPTLRLVTEDLERQIGDGAPAATLRTSTFELFRILHGRRTVEQVRAFEWEGDPGPWAEKLAIFGPTKEKVEG